MKTIKILMLLCAVSILIGCKDYLDAKPNKKLAVLDNLPAMQALLDDHQRLIFQGVNGGEATTDDYYALDADLATFEEEFDVRKYSWKRSYIYDKANNDWSNTYNLVYYGNSILDETNKLDKQTVDANQFNNIRGQAFFYKASGLINAAYLWAPIYNPTTAERDLGVPIRANSDFNVKTTRASVLANYNQVISDAKQAAQLLPNIAVHVVRPSKNAAYALLARTYLAMGIYTEASLYADSCLSIKSDLLDYNTLVPTASFPIVAFNKEVIMEGRMSLPLLLTQDYAKINPGLYQLYEANDLRKTIFFKTMSTSIYAFKGNYTGSTPPFTGLALDEIYLIKAECLARANKVTEANDILERLLIKRYKTGTYLKFVPSSQQAMLDKVFLERRKELVMRGLRWIDVKRLNRDGANITMTRIVGGATLTLLPNSSGYCLPIPEAIIELTGIKQNP